jgi:hypothetical protein
VVVGQCLEVDGSLLERAFGLIAAAHPDAAPRGSCPEAARVHDKVAGAAMSSRRSGALE